MFFFVKIKPTTHYVQLSDICILIHQTIENVISLKICSSKITSYALENLPDITCMSHLAVKFMVAALMHVPLQKIFTIK